MKNLYALVILCTLSPVNAGEPTWLFPWQERLVAHLRSIEPEQVRMEVKPVLAEHFRSGEGLRHLYLVDGYTPLLSFVAGGVALPAEDFLWKGIWRPQAKLNQSFLTETHHGLTSGQLWIPAHPSTANLLAWAYSNAAPWNPYAGDERLARRAAIISIVDLLAWTENNYYENHPKSSKTGRKWGLHSAITGFSLTFNAFSLLKVGDSLPADVREAWRAGILHMCSQINARMPTGPMNMRFSIPVGMEYAFRATENEAIARMAKRWAGMTVFGPELSLAGHHWEGQGRAPDGSYNGIALHRLAELYNVTDDENVLTLLRHGYRLKNHLSLPMPNGRWISPSHFNDRCQSSFANDQYAGREPSFILDAPEAVPFLRHFRVKKKPVVPAELVKHSKGPSSRIAKASPWGRGGRMHDWGMVLHLPDYIYHQEEEKIQEALAKNYVLPVLASDSFSQNFNNEFFCIRKPSYYAILYAGAAVSSDDGRTNSRGMLKDQGGLFNGFAGGGISAFWTPAGTFWLGRMTAYENYERKKVKVNNRIVFVPGWQDWANNHVIGKTKSGKILTSARTSWPKSDWDEKKGTLSITGVMPKTLQRQGEITKASVTVKRNYRFHEDRLKVGLTIRSNKSESFQSFYETIPLHITEDLKIAFFDAGGKELKAGVVIHGVSRITLDRQNGGVDLLFSSPQTIEQRGRKVKSKQAGFVYVRSLQVALPLEITPKTVIQLDYELVPRIETGKGMALIPDALPYGDSGELVAPEDSILAHYHAAKGLKVDKAGRVKRWKDLSKNGLDLYPFGDQVGNAPIKKKGERPSLAFNGMKSLITKKFLTLRKSITLIAVVKVSTNALKKHTDKHRRIVSMIGKSGADHTHGTTLITNQIQGGRIEVTSLTTRRRASKPSMIGLGRMLLWKDGKLSLGGAGLNGEILEVYVYSPAVPAGILKSLVKGLKNRYQTVDEN